MQARVARCSTRPCSLQTTFAIYASLGRPVYILLWPRARMNESKEGKVSSLLQQGLELYGTGDVARAFLLWGEVLELDPGNDEALDYIKDADRRAKPRGGTHGLGESSLMDETRRLLRAENAESGLSLLRTRNNGFSAILLRLGRGR